MGSEDGDTTNIRMEGKALIAALKDANGAPCVIYSDSEFWINVVLNGRRAGKSAAGRKRAAILKIWILYANCTNYIQILRRICVGYVAMKAMKGMSWRTNGLIGRVKAKD